MAVSPETYEVHHFDSWTDLVVEPDEPHIRTVRLKIRVPEVIALTGYDRIPTQSVAFSRRNLFKRDKNTCQYCGRKPGTAGLTIDHVMPRSRGGRSTWKNCVLACVACNRRKADRMLHEAGMYLLSEPVTPKWRPTLNVPVGRVRQSWEKFVSDLYWDVELEP